MDLLQGIAFVPNSSTAKHGATLSDDKRSKEKKHKKKKEEKEESKDRHDDSGDTSNILGEEDPVAKGHNMYVNMMI